ncbi:hypothetical protein WN51_02909 [Melipona quadrifasciata]|uniref:Uncharacterized protein n=1 Tax=Melipona quadrifasciata TaxID=166423 RepID=A0A0M9AB38_9HYME|nr:hypothetical protein WN51_02909 [Melipona quadrifasciata]
MIETCYKTRYNRFLIMFSQAVRFNFERIRELQTEPSIDFKWNWVGSLSGKCWQDILVRLLMEFYGEFLRGGNTEVKKTCTPVLQLYDALRLSTIVLEYLIRVKVFLFLLNFADKKKFAHTTSNT